MLSVNQMKYKSLEMSSDQMTESHFLIQLWQSIFVFGLACISEFLRFSWMTETKWGNIFDADVSKWLELRLYI